MLTGWSRRRRQLEEEIRAHLALEAEENREAGMTPDEARLAAQRRFGNELLALERSREIWGALWVERLVQDLRFALRQLRKSPGFTLTAVLTLALGIGANTAIFSVLDAVLFRPLPYKDSARLVWPTLRFPRMIMHRSFVPHPIYFAWRDQNDVFSGIAATHFGGNYTLTGDGAAERIAGMRVSANYFSVLGANLACGRSFTPEEDRPEGRRAAILSYGLWQSRYGGNPAVLGRPIILDDEDYVIVGVLPADFRCPTSGKQPQVFLPLAASADARSGIWYIQVIARLKPGVTRAQAQANLSVIDDHALPLLPKFFGRYTRDVHLSVPSLHDHLTGDVRGPLWMLMLAVLFILLIACANVANLQLSRGSLRFSEFAMRAALGASRSRLAGQLVTESIVLSAMGGSLGLIGGVWGDMLLRTLLPRGLLNTQDIRIEATALAFTVLVSMLAGVVSGFAPILALYSSSLNASFQSGRTRITGSRESAILRSLLVVGEVAAAIVLLVAAGLLLNSFLRLRRVNYGFDPHKLLTAQLFLPSDKYSAESQQAAFAAQLLERVGALPGVQAASIATSLPIRLQNDMRVGIEGRPIPAANDLGSFVPLDSVSDAYFQVLGIPILSGRGFDKRDGPKTPKVAVVNEEFIRSFFPRNENPIGRRILLGVGSPGQTPVSIVGVSAAIRRAGPRSRQLPQIFLPFAQAPSTDLTILLRAASDPDALVSPLRSQVLALDRELPLANAATLDDLLAGEITGQRFEAFAIGLFAALALVLACVGIYGVISCLVSQRALEIGIRIALGATRAGVMRLVLRQAGWMVFAGIIPGLAGAWAVGRSVRSFLFGVKALDPASLAGALGILVLAGTIAALLPAWRAARVDPMEVLRVE